MSIIGRSAARGAERRSSSLKSLPHCLSVFLFFCPISSGRIPRVLHLFVRPYSISKARCGGDSTSSSVFHAAFSRSAGQNVQPTVECPARLDCCCLSVHLRRVRNTQPPARDDLADAMRRAILSTSDWYRTGQSSEQVLVKAVRARASCEQATSLRPQRCICIGQHSSSTFGSPFCLCICRSGPHRGAPRRMPNHTKVTSPPYLVPLASILLAVRWQVRIGDAVYNGMGESFRHEWKVA
jgi:hypothetical protein